MKRHAQATERNREPLLAVLREVLPTSGTVLQDGDQLVVAVTDELVQRVHRVVESPREGAH